MKEQGGSLNETRLHSTTVISEEEKKKYERELTTAYNNFKGLFFSFLKFLFNQSSKSSKTIFFFINSNNNSSKLFLSGKKSSPVVITQLKIINPTSPQTIQVNTPSSVLKIESQDTSGTPTDATAKININLTSTDTKIGPLELYNGATLKSTFLNGIPPTVDRSGDWGVDPPYAAGSAIGNYAPGFTANTGISVSIPSDMHSSSQSFILKNHIILPTPSGGWAKARITRIQLAIDYTITSTDPGLLLACI